MPLASVGISISRGDSLFVFGAYTRLNTSTIKLDIMADNLDDAEVFAANNTPGWFIFLLVVLFVWCQLLQDTSPLRVKPWTNIATWIPTTRAWRVGRRVLDLIRQSVATPVGPR